MLFRYLSRHLAVRPIPVDWIRTKFPNGTTDVPKQPSTHRRNRSPDGHVRRHILSGNRRSIALTSYHHRSLCS
jgi:hypothetical protein